MFPYRSFVAFILLSIFGIFSLTSLFLYYRVYPVIQKRNAVWEHEAEQRALETHKRVTHDFLFWKIGGAYQRLKPYDEARFFDCRWKAHDVIPQPFFAYPYLKFFNTKDSTDIFSGLAKINDWPTLLYVANGARYHHRRSRVLLGIRGSDYGIHKSNLPMEMLALVKRSGDYKDDLIFLPDNYVFIDADGSSVTEDRLQAACHNRTYSGGRVVTNEWKFFDHGYFWSVYDEIFINEQNLSNDNVFIFAYSNGSTPRHQLMKVRETGKCGSDTVEEYSKCHEMADKRSFRIKAIADLETNYDGLNLMPTAMFINQNIRGRPGRYYYAICASEDCPVSNHYELIRLLKLKPKHMEQDWVRWQDEEERIVIDMMRPFGKQHLTHSSVIPFGIREFEKISLDSR